MNQEELMRLVDLLPPGRLKDDLVAGRLGTLTTLTAQAVMIPSKLDLALCLSNDETTGQEEHVPVVHGPSTGQSVIHEGSLLAWASELSEEDLVLPDPVSYLEIPPRTVTTGRVSHYASHYLKTIVSARHHQQHSRLCWGQWTPAWWQEREGEALYALAALRKAVEASTAKGRKR